ncbi:alpha/beta hydrolase fold-3 domain-containing protein [Xylariomycetidae sp. FL2044]|nr:alpha/beta hydrolase fold-3 domain-containing protein [Xylariomycetidae sp. FL2044]
MTTVTKHPLISHQPFKALFQFAYAGIIVVSIPFWLAASILRPLRPHPEWTVKQAFMTRVGYALVDIHSRVSITEPLSLQGGKEGDRFQTITPRFHELYKGPLESDTVKPATVGGTWYPQRPPADIASKLVVLYLHGGAFIRNTGRFDDGGFPAKCWLEDARADAVFNLQYRLSGYSGLDPFPAALQDALTSYLYLLRDLKIPARQIVLGGDSAGGNLAIAFLRYLHEHGTGLALPAPRCAVLASPWVAPFKYEAVWSNSLTWPMDFVPRSFLRWGANAYAAGISSDPRTDPYITPLNNPFPTSVPIFVNAGTAEVFFTDITRWAEEMKISKNVVVLNLEDAGCHDTLLLGAKLGFEQSAQRVAVKMGEFIRGS